MFSCTFCGKMVQSKAALNSHLLSHTKEKPQTCRICEATFRYISSLNQHVKTVHDGMKQIRKKNTQCPLCSYKCYSKTCLEKHLRKHTAEHPFSCDEPSCGFKTKYKQSLKQHVRNVHGNKIERPYQCPSDGWNCKFQWKGSPKLHLQVHSNEKPFACKVPGCNFSCKSKEYLNRHTSRAHSDEKPFKCSNCDFRAKVKQDLAGHQRTHMNTKPFKCQAPYCDFSTNWNNSFLRHFDRKHRKKDLRCTEPGCQYSCSSTTLLRIHLNGNGKPMLKCPGDGCSYTTRVKQNLRRHMSRFHEDIKSGVVVGPRKCDLGIASVVGVVETLQCCVPNCGYQTKFRHYYDRHIVTHKNEEKWQHVCPFCFCRFSKLHEVKLHIQRHTREKPYRCSFCKYTALLGQELKLHAAKDHHVHVNPRGKEDEVIKCRTCGRNCLCYSEFVVHSMSHLQAAVVLEKLNLETL